MHGGGTCFCISQSMVVIMQVIVTGSSNGMKLMIGQRMAELSAGCRQGIVEAVVGIVHLIRLKCRFQTAFIKSGIVSHEGDSGNLVSHIIQFLAREEYVSLVCSSNCPPHPQRIQGHHLFLSALCHVPADSNSYSSSALAGSGCRTSQQPARHEP